MTEVARSRQAHGFSTKKKKKINTENQKIPITSLVTSLPEKSNPNITAYTEQISKTKSNSSKEKPNTDSQSDRGVYLKKKKKSPIHKPKPSPSKPNPKTHGHVTATPQLVIARPSLQIGDRRSQIGDRSAPLPLLRCSVLGALPPALPQDISLFFSLFLSLKWKKWEYDMKFLQKATDRRLSSEIGSASAQVQRCLLPVAPSGSPALPQGFSLWLSLSLSLSISLKYWMKKWKVIYERFSLYSLTLITIWSHISVSLSLFWTASYWLAFTFFFFFFLSFLSFFNLALSFPFLLVSVLVFFFFFAKSQCVGL